MRRMARPDFFAARGSRESGPPRDLSRGVTGAGKKVRAKPLRHRSGRHSRPAPQVDRRAIKARVDLRASGNSQETHGGTAAVADDRRRFRHRTSAAVTSPARHRPTHAFEADARPGCAAETGRRHGTPAQAVGIGSTGEARPCRRRTRSAGARPQGTPTDADPEPVPVGAGRGARSPVGRSRGKRKPFDRDVRPCAS